jgi:hypothetical protein
MLLLRVLWAVKHGTAPPAQNRFKGLAQQPKACMLYVYARGFALYHSAAYSTIATNTKVANGIVFIS